LKPMLLANFKILCYLHMHIMFISKDKKTFWSLHDCRMTDFGVDESNLVNLFVRAVHRTFTIHSIFAPGSGIVLQNH
jgi:hypothetical protein